MISDKPETRVIADDSIYHASYLPQVRLEEHHVRQLVEVIIRDSSSSRRIAKMCRSLWNASYKIGLSDQLFGFDTATGEAVIELLRTYMYTRFDCEVYLRKILLESGEMARMDAEYARKRAKQQRRRK